MELSHHRKKWSTTIKWWNEHPRMWSKHIYVLIQVEAIRSMGYLAGAIWPYQGAPDMI